MINKDTVLNNWEVSKIPSPAYVLHESLLAENMEVIDRVRKQSGAEVIVALKANAMWSIFPELRRHSDGATASSLAEARLVFEEYGQPAHTYAPVYPEGEIDEILRYSSHITFNSLEQYRRFGGRAHRRGVSCGLRVNPEYSTVETDLYNPASRTSRLGVLAEHLDELPEGLEGLHFHSLCESRPAQLRATLAAFEARFGRFFPQIKWLNMGGGHLMTHKDYDETELIRILQDFKCRYPHLRVILEPGSAFTWDTGCLVATVEDKVCNGGVNTLMLNVSFACHMPDCLEMPYKPVILGTHDPLEGEKRWRMGGNSCLAGDFCGDWAFDHEREPQIGDRLVFRDMIHYTMVKTTLFNGVTHPSIGICSPAGEFRLIRQFGYEDYKGRMS
ncbi:MAG: carboxynorspermidine decarboxylase [Odoribacter sp.]